jgi:hypothetical protein
MTTVHLSPTTTRNARLAPILRAFARARGDFLGAEAILMNERRPEAAAVCSKAAAQPLTSSDDPALVTFRNDLSEAIRDVSLLGRLARANRRPFNVRLITATSGPNASFTVPGKPAPATSLALEVTRTLTPHWCAAISAVSAEVLAPGAVSDEALIRMMTAAAGEAIDRAMLDPDNAGNDATPASLTAGSLRIERPLTYLDIDQAMVAMMASLTAAKTIAAPIWIADPGLTAFMTTSRQTHGTLNWSTVGFTGGTLAGAPLVVTTAARASGSPSAGTLMLVDATQVDYALEADELSVTNAPAVQLDDAPADSAQPLTSLFQAGLVGMKVGSYVDWGIRRSGAVAIATFG